MSEPIQFDKADYVEVSSLDCKLCKQPLMNQYYDMGGSTICTACREKITEGRADGSGFHRFIRAFGFGFVVAALGATVYAFIVYKFRFEFGLMAVFLGYGVGRAVSVGSYHRGGWRYQALAVVLTYAAICMEFLPEMLHGRAYTVPLVIVAFVISLFGPFLVLSQGVSGLIGIFIIGIGIYEAWKLNKKGIGSIGGPYPISPSLPQGNTAIDQ